MENRRLNTYVLGITGQAGSGKSTLAKAFVELGAVLIDADQIAKKLVNSNAAIHNQLKKTFGKSFFDEHGQLKRRKLGQHVFSDDEILNRLNVIVWPMMIREIHERINEFKQKKVSLVIVDMAVLYETDIDAFCDQVIAVIAPYSILAQRMKERNGWSTVEAVKRLAAQQSDQAFRKKADIIVENDGNVSLLIENAKDIFLNLNLVRNSVCLS